MSGIFEVQHPLIANHLARLRDVSTPPTEFRVLVQRLAVLLAYEATKDLELAPAHVQTPLAVTSGGKRPANSKARRLKAQGYPHLDPTRPSRASTAHVFSGPEPHQPRDANDVSLRRSRFWPSRRAAAG